MFDNNKFDFSYNVFYELVGKEKTEEQIICYFVFYADNIDGAGTFKIVLSKNCVEYEKLKLGYNYMFTKENGKIEMVDYYKLFREKFLCSEIII